MCFAGTKNWRILFSLGNRRDILPGNRYQVASKEKKTPGKYTVHNYEFRDALLRTTNLKKAEKNKLTWIDFVHDRDIWRMVVLNNFNTYSLLHPMTFRRADNEG